MKIQAARQTKSSLRTLYLFCFVVLFLIGTSLCIKIFHSIRSSIYDPKHAFVLAVTCPDGAVFYNIVPGKKELDNFRVLSPVKDTDLPSDAEIATSDSVGSVHLKKLLPHLFVRGGQLTWFDAARLIFVTSGMSEEKGITSSKEGISLDLGSTLSDPDILEEDLSIGIVNATGISGVGARIEKKIFALGASVVSVTTARGDEENSVIEYSGKSSHTVKRLSAVLKMPLSVSSDTLSSDILIVVGKNKKGL